MAVGSKNLVYPLFFIPKIYGFFHGTAKNKAGYMPFQYKPEIKLA